MKLDVDLLLRSHRKRVAELESAAARTILRDKIRDRVSAAEPNWVTVDGLCVRLGLGLAISASDELVNGSLSDARQLCDGWQLVVLGRWSVEMDLLRLARKYSDFAKFHQEIASDDPSGYLIQCWSLCGLTILDSMVDVSDWVHLFEAAQVRDGIPNTELASFRAQLPLLKVLDAKRPRQVTLKELAQHEPFGGLDKAWKHDEGFRSLLGSAVKWHVEQCASGLRSRDYRYYQEPFALLPTWILALDRARERELGKSCLPDDDLMAIASRLAKVPVRGGEDGLVTIVRESAVHKAGNSKGSDALEFWRSFTNPRW